MLDLSRSKLPGEQPLKLLLVEADAASQLAVLEAIWSGGSRASVACVTSCRAALELLRGQEFHALLVSAAIVDSEQERGALHDLAMTIARRDVALLLVGARANSAEAIAALGYPPHGVLDYAQLSAASLERAVMGAIERMRALSASERLAHAERLTHLGRASAGLLHELNNLLTGVVARIALVRDELAEPRPAASPSELSDDLEQAWDASTRMAALIRDAGRFARASGATKAVRIEQVLDSAVRLASQRLPAPLVVKRDYATTALVLADEVQLCQVFLNLLLNAHHALGDQPTVGRADALLMTTRLQAPGWVLISVEDRGCGMSEELVELAFQPFFTTKPPTEGSGLGLWLCRDIVARFGGTISLKSRVGQGTRCDVRLPLHAAKDVPA